VTPVPLLLVVVLLLVSALALLLLQLLLGCMGALARGLMFRDECAAATCTQSAAAPGDTSAAAVAELYVLPLRVGIC
jgi:hypothetical protein